MPEPEIRCWKDPTWEIGMSAGRRTIRLILHHPATHARLGSGFFPADTPADAGAPHRVGQRARAGGTAVKYRKKPVVIDALQYDGTNHEAVGEFAGQAVSLEDGTLYVRTLENRRLEADVGDWIIRGVAGEFYPCKPGIFAATYEPVAEVSRLQGLPW